MAFSKIKKSLVHQRNSDTRLSMIACIHLLRTKPDQVKNNFWKSEIDKIAAVSIYVSHISEVAKQIYYDDNDYNWIEESARQHNFIDLKIRNILEPTKPNHVMPNLFPTQGYTNRDKIIGLIDYYSIEIPKYAINNDDLNLHLKGLWEIFTKSDIKFDWLQGENSEKARDHLLRYLKRKHSDLMVFRQDFRNHDELMIFFDQPTISPEKKFEILENAKKLWDQNLKRKENTQNAQCNYTLPTLTKNAIKKLAEKYRLSQTEIVMIVMDSEAQNEYHLKNRLNYKKNMLNQQNFNDIPKEQLIPKPEGEIKSPPPPEL